MVQEKLHARRRVHIARRRIDRPRECVERRNECLARGLLEKRIARRGLAKKKGGIGKKTTGITRRTFKPNIQRVRIVEGRGRVRRAKVCAACIRAGKVRKAP